jgi:homoserine kinase
VVLPDRYVHRFDVGEAVSPVLLIPETVRLATSVAREALPPEVPRSDAVFNVGHAALLVRALSDGDLDLLRVALHDRLHQERRLALVPEVRDVFEALHRSRPVCVSGSGPTLLAFERAGFPIPDPGDGWRVLRVPVRPTGVEILEG